MVSIRAADRGACVKEILLSDWKFFGRNLAGLLILAATLGTLGACSPGAGIEGTAST